MLGPLGVEWHGKPLAPGPVRLQALLSVLASKANHAASVGAPRRAEELLNQALAIAGEFIPTYTPKLRGKLAALPL